MEMDQDGPNVLLSQPVPRRSTLLLQRLRSWITRKGRGTAQPVLGLRPDEEAPVSADPSMIRRWASDQKSIINTNYGAKLPESRMPGLEKLVLSSPSLMSSLCFSKTLGMFGQFAHTIRILSISYETRDQHRWVALLEQIQLPRLDSLYCHGAVVLFVAQPTITAEMIISFVSRHPALTHLEIRNIPPLLDHPETIPLLPNLRSLVSHATFTAFLLQNPDNCRHLNSVFILSQAPKAPVPASYNFYPSMDSTLTSIASFASGATQLRLDFATVSDVSGWMNEHIRLDSASVLRKLTQVHHLKVWPVLNASRIPGGSLLEVLPKWLALFPSLEVLYVGITGAQVFYDEVVGSCPQLKVFNVDRKHILPIPKEPGAGPWY
ncbi:hypothetical protein P691DRAFT_802804 [Macrolepiota fuliginosa MF-IS2]|uniref:F-box domain-containing protein n=1 Tax=Macrolepiota fuliginosa MF-IS2 TaxID=1400762 RepID=A0A9P5XLC4_9AGAR|nr:hypothetical protein P691DRAFT_802804 [Macrolepiota fuliginosa MF-IS2]